MNRKQKQITIENKQVEQKLEKEHAPLGTAVEANKEKKLQGPNRPST